jgi:hypothetical protein
LADSKVQSAYTKSVEDFRAMIEQKLPALRKSFSEADLLTRKRMHIRLVNQIAGVLIDMIRAQVRDHDADKIQAYSRGEIVDQHTHHLTQRHHIFNNDAIKTDVNVVDLVECLCDNIAAAILEGHDGSELLNINSSRNKAVTMNRILVNTAFLVRDTKWLLSNDSKAWD